MFNEPQTALMSEYPVARLNVRDVLETSETRQPAGRSARAWSIVANPEAFDAPLPLRTALERVAVHHRITTVAVFAQIDRLMFMDAQIPCRDAWTGRASDRIGDVRGAPQPTGRRAGDGPEGAPTSRDVGHDMRGRQSRRLTPNDRSIAVIEFAERRLQDVTRGQAHPADHLDGGVDVLLEACSQPSPTTTTVDVPIRRSSVPGSMV